MFDYDLRCSKMVVPDPRTADSGRFASTYFNSIPLYTQKNKLWVLVKNFPIFY